MKLFLLAIWEVLEVVIVAVATVFLIRTFLIQPFLVSGASMEPNFDNGNYLIIDELSYRFRQPERGEVVVFRYPNNPSIFYIKRIIGLPGEKVVVENGAVKILNKDYPSGLLLDENYLPKDIKTIGDISRPLNENQYFVLGDNRGHSYDSRSWGPISRDNIIGLVKLRLWPITQAEVFSPPSFAK